MGAIRVLPDQLINQIAAGEVIERPASVVKELVENSIDAKATHITIEILKGGTDKIIITDDGIGMDEMDTRLSFERHATSKLLTKEDLFKIQSLGFRGEALASIASVSKVSLQTKTASSLGGIKLEMEGGKEPVVTATGCPVGTKFEVSNLFFNTPARKKYLKSEQTEYRHVLELIQDLSLAHPEVAFKFVSNGRTVFDLMKTDSLLPRIGNLFGKSVSDSMVEIFYGGRDTQISGFVGKPHTARTTRKYQYFIINGRPVKDHRLAYAVKEAYSDLIPSSQHPIFVVDIKLDPSMVDVNVHPRKLEVRFADPQDAFRVVKSTVNAAVSREHMTQNVPIREKNLDTPAFMRKDKIVATQKQTLDFEEKGESYDPTVQPTSTWTPQPSTGFNPSASMGSGMTSNIFGGSTPAVSPGMEIPSGDSNSMDARKAYLLQKRAARMAARGETPMASPSPTTTQQTASSIFSPSTTPSVTSMPVIPPTQTQVPDSNLVANFTQSYSEIRTPNSIRPIAQVKNSYILAEDDEGIVIIDQHAAHERVMLEKFRSNEAEREPTKQPLLVPVQLDLDYREKAVLEENLELLGSIGFDISEFGGNTFTVDAVPDFLVKDDAQQIVKGFIDDLLNDQAPRESARRHEHILHTLACKAATKFGRRLTSYEQEALIKSLLATDGASSCAHGRPTMIRLSFNELEQKFGRKG
jgi:DNA mismatch repair protein MutL